MTVSPIDFNALIAIRPLGTLNPPDHTQPTRHTYWYAGDPGNPPPPDQLAAVYSPGEIRLVEITEATYSNRPYETDYTLRFFVCDNVSGYFNHVSVLSDQFAAMVGDFNQGQCDTYSTSSETITRCTLQTSLDLSAGMLLGEVSYYGTLDFGMDDSRISHYVANPNHFGFIEHAVCPMDYYQDSMKLALLDMTGEYDGSQQRTVEPRCGKVDFDISGTASGAWVLSPVPANTFIESVSIALAEDNIDPSMAAFSIGNVGSNIDAQVLRFLAEEEGTINRRFDEVTADGELYCYDLGGSSVVIQLVDANNLQFEAQSISCGSQSSFGNNVINFAR